MYWPRRIFVLVLLWQYWKDSDCVASSQAEDALRDVFEDQTHFSEFLIWLENAKVCLRRGEIAENACYILSDFEPGSLGETLDMRKMRQEMMAVDQWKANPFNNIHRCEVWYNRLWNSIALILTMERQKRTESCPLLLARAASSGNERYAAIDHRIEEGETFSKGLVEQHSASDEESKEESKAGKQGGRIGEILRLNVAESQNDVAATVRRVLMWMKHKARVM